MRPRFRHARWFGAIAFGISLAACNKSSEGVVCYSVTRNGQQIDLAIPRALMPSKSDQNGGARFHIWFGVDLKDFSPASNVPTADRNVAEPDWSIEKYGWNPGMALSSGYAKSSHLKAIEAGTHLEVETDIPGFRRFTQCTGCGVDLYVPRDPSGIELIRCYLPGEPNGKITACIVYDRFGSAGLQYSLPYRTRQDPNIVRGRILDLLSSFEDEGRSKCRT
jgi:hypothetical protein